MTKAETKRLLQLMASIYPNWKPENLDLAVEAWSAVLAEEEAQDMADALKLYARKDSSGFAPAPGQLLAMKESVKWKRVEAALTAKIYGLPEPEGMSLLEGGT